MIQNPMKLILSVLIVYSVGQSQGVVINELMSANFRTIADEDSEYTDWLEIYNSGTVSADLTGFGLSDDIDSLNKWVFPQVLLPANEFLMVYASDKDRRLWVNHWETVIDRGDTCYYRV